MQKYDVTWHWIKKKKKVMFYWFITTNEYHTVLIQNGQGGTTQLTDESLLQNRKRLSHMECVPV